MKIGPYRGEVAERFRRPDFLAGLEGLALAVGGAGAQVVSAGRNRNVRLSLERGGAPVDLLVKAFGRESGLKNFADRKRGSKAQRSWEAAVALAGRGVGTPAPVGYLERWEGGRLVESYFLADYLADRPSFRDALIALYHDDPDCARCMALLEVVARGIRVMHDAGFQHNDLGNQNILLQRDGAGGWCDPTFIDLNRGRLHETLTLRQRARDLSRITLPSDFLRVFLEMYWVAVPCTRAKHGAGQVPPVDLLRWEARYRRMYAVHAGTRRWRHPLREARQARRDRGVRGYPDVKDVWIWDERSAQAISVMRSRERTRHYPVVRHLRLVADTVRVLPRVMKEYPALLQGAFRSPVEFANRVGMALDPQPGRHARELALLRGLGRLPVLVRFYHHENRERREFRAKAVLGLVAEGYPVSIALVQDRRAVREPARWREFAGEVLERVGGAVEMVEVGHAINRVKWGVWDFRELRGLYEVFGELRQRFPTVAFTGPAAIDFEYPFVASALRELPKGITLAGLSHHLYVDRRGAPENRQGRFAALEKIALARALARSSPNCADRLIISEVNWPLLGTGVYSPVGSPYVSPGPRFNDPSVSEDDYADYMIRYFCLALCSGLVERVFWWRLVARGFGLVDDTDPAAWRERPAYAMLRAFLATLGGATFESAQLPVGARNGGDTRGVYAYSFVRADGERVALVYAHGAPVPFVFEGRFVGVEDAFGRMLGAPPESLTGRPVYLRGVGACR